MGDKTDTETVSKRHIEGNPVKEPLNNPRIKYIFYFSAHGNPNDFKGLFDLIKDADVYVPEAFGWTIDYLDIYQDVSFGRKTPQQVVDVVQAEGKDIDPLALVELQALYNTRKQVVFVDLPQEEAIHTSGLFLGARNFDGLLRNVQHSLEGECELNQKRDERMVSHLMTRVVEVVKSNPDLNTKDDAIVVISLGSVHTGVYHRLKDSGGYAERIFDVIPQVYSYNEEGLRRMLWGKPVDDELLARILLETAFGNVFRPELERVTVDNAKIDLYIRKAVSLFGIEKIREIFGSLIYTRWEYFKETFEDEMTHSLGTMGWWIPHSEAQMDRLLGDKLI